MVTQIHRNKRRKTKIVNKKVNKINVIHTYMSFFLITASLKDIKLYKVIIIRMYC